jgi:hypothetical protein
MEKENVQAPVPGVYKAETGVYHFEDAQDETMEIWTKNYENGSKTKRCALSDGRIANCRRLKGKDNALIQRLTNSDSAKVQLAVAALSTQIDDKDVVIEDLEGLWYNDFTKILAMSSSINFL